MTDIEQRLRDVLASLPEGEFSTTEIVRLMFAGDVPDGATFKQVMALGKQLGLAHQGAPSTADADS